MWNPFRRSKLVLTEEEEKLRLARSLSEPFSQRPRVKKWKVDIPRPTIEEDEAEILGLQELAQEAAAAERRAIILAETEKEKLRGAENIRDSIERTQRIHAEAEEIYRQIPKVIGTQPELTPIQRQVAQERAAVQLKEQGLNRREKQLNQKEQKLKQQTK